MGNGAEFWQMQHQEEHQQWLQEQECCVYCGKPKARKSQCCGEVHFESEEVKNERV